MLLEELAQLLGHARVTLAPVIDLATSVSVNGYEHPETVKDRTRLRTVGDVFPHARTISRKIDMDHPDPYDPHGPPGQTGDHNAAPLGRRHHRAKTHLAYRADSSVSRDICGAPRTVADASWTPPAPTSSTPPKPSSSNTPEHSTLPSTGSKPVSASGHRARARRCATRGSKGRPRG